MLHPKESSVLTVLLTISVSTATTEQLFSTLRRVKTYMLSTMTAEQLSSLVLMFAYRDTPIDTENTIR